MSRQILNVEKMRERDFDDAAFIGIASALPAYRFCWTVNRQLGIGFARDPEQTLSLQKKGNFFYFPIYVCHLPEEHHSYTLYRLRSGAETLLPEIRQMDYLWLVKTAFPAEDAAKITALLRGVPEVQLARIFFEDELPNLNNLFS